MKRLGSFSHFDGDIVRRKEMDAERNKQNKIQREMDLWKKNQRQNIYASDVTEKYHSLKDVLKKRVQFCKKARAQNDRIKKLRIKVEDYEKYTPKVISLEH